MKDILDKVVDSIKNLLNPTDEMEKLMKILLLYEVAWTRKGMIPEIITLIDRLPITEIGNVDNLDYISSRLITALGEEDKNFVLAAEHFFLTYAEAGQVWKLKRNVKLKTKGYCQQFDGIKKEIK
jgi:hypothetical protein